MKNKASCVLVVLGLLLSACSEAPAPALLPAATAPAPAEVTAPAQTSGAVSVTKPGPTQFATALEAFEEFNDYTPEMETLAIESTTPLTIRVSPTALPGQEERLVREAVRRAAVHAALRVFLHTDATQVRVASQPVLLDARTYTRTLLVAPRATLNVTRSEVESVVRAELGLPDLSGLVGTMIGDIYSADSWSDIARRVMYSDEGPPSAEKFAKRLGLAWD